MKELTPILFWHDISHEKYREYGFLSDGKIVTFKIENPISLNVSKSNGHRILDAKDIAYYIPPKWIYIKWETNDDTAIRF